MEYTFLDNLIPVIILLPIIVGFILFASWKGWINPTKPY